MLLSVVRIVYSLLNPYASAAIYPSEYNAILFLRLKYLKYIIVL